MNSAPSTPKPRSNAETSSSLAETPRQTVSSLYRRPRDILPEGWAKCESHWHYGWPVTDKMLITLLMTHFGQARDSVMNMDISVGTSIARFHLKRRSRCSDLRIIYCKPDEQAETEGQVVTLQDQRLVQVFTMTCTASKRLLERWATKEQFERLVPMLGEPRWFEDCFTKKEFRFSFVK